MTPRPEQIADLFECPAWASAGHADRDSVAQLTALGATEIPDGFERWVEKRQREYRAGRHHARAALGAAGAPGLEVPRGFDGLPCFPGHFCGTITHTGRNKTFAAAAVCREPTRLGLDAELLRPLEQAMVDLILTPGERSRAESLPRAGDAQLDLNTVAILTFSAKEAFYKCVYPSSRQRLGFHDAEVRLETEPLVPTRVHGTFVVRLRSDLTQRAPDELPQELPGRYLLADPLVVCGVTWRR